MATTLDEALAHIGDGVIYAPKGGGVDSAEEGTITSVNDSWVFVRFGSSRQPAACDPADLTLLAPPGTFDNSWSDDPPAVLQFQPREEAERWLTP